MRIGDTPVNRSLFPRARPTKPAAKKPPELPPIKAVHPFVDSGTTDAFGEPICAREDCGSVRKARVHQLPDTPPDAAEVDARILGETN